CYDAMARRRGRVAPTRSPAQAPGLGEGWVPGHGRRRRGRPGGMGCAAGSSRDAFRPLGLDRCLGARGLRRRPKRVVLAASRAVSSRPARRRGAGLSTRVGFQFHWHNDGYRNMDDFLARFRSKDRNAIKRERRAPTEQGISLRTVRGDELSRAPREWAKAVHGLHTTTVRKLMW